MACVKFSQIDNSMKTCTDFASLQNQFTPSTYIWRMHEEHDTFSTFIFLQLAKRGESNYQNVVRHGSRRRERKRGDEKDIIELCTTIFCCRKLRHNFLWNFQIVRYYVGMSMSLAISTSNYFITQYSDSPRGMETKQDIRPTHSNENLVSELSSAAEMFNFKPFGVWELRNNFKIRSDEFPTNAQLILTRHILFVDLFNWKLVCVFCNRLRFNSILHCHNYLCDSIWTQW